MTRANVRSGLREICIAALAGCLVLCSPLFGEDPFGEAPKPVISPKPAEKLAAERRQALEQAAKHLERNFRRAADRLDGQTKEIAESLDVIEQARAAANKPGAAELLIAMKEIWLERKAANARHQQSASKIAEKLDTLNLRLRHQAKPEWIEEQIAELDKLIQAIGGAAAASTTKKGVVEEAKRLIPKIRQRETELERERGDLEKEVDRLFLPSVKAQAEWNNHLARLELLTKDRAALDDELARFARLLESDRRGEDVMLEGKPANAKVIQNQIDSLTKQRAEMAQERKALESQSDSLREVMQSASDAYRKAKQLLKENEGKSNSLRSTRERAASFVDGLASVPSELFDSGSVEYERRLRAFEKVLADSAHAKQ